MAISVARVLELPGLREARLIAGRAGLSNEVDGIGLMESLDSIEWLTARKLIVNNARAFASCSDQEWAGLIESFVDRGVPGLVIKLGRYVSAVPARALQRADELAFPIIVPPFDSEPAQIISDVYFELFNAGGAPTEGEDVRADVVLRDIALGREDWRVLRANVAGLGWQVTRPYGVAVVYGAEMPTAGKGIGPFREAACEAGFPHGFFVAGRYVAIALLDGESDLERALRARAERFLRALERRAQDGSWRLGLGGFHDSLLSLPECCTEAGQALAVSRAVSEAERIVAFDDLGFLGILLEGRNRDCLERVYQQAFSLLKQHDEEAGTEYAETVRVYACVGMSTKLAAEALFVHENTVRYRISTVKDYFKEKRFGAGIGLNFKLLCLLCRLRDARRGMVKQAEQ